jgi:hypothetical protein
MINALIAISQTISPGLIALGLWLSPQAPDRWADPNDYQEAIYIEAPANACTVYMQDGVIVVHLCEA